MESNIAFFTNSLANVTTHSPSTGFIDIKPFNDTLEFLNFPFINLVYIILFLILIFLAYVIYTKQNSPINILAETKPETEFNKTISALKVEGIPVREFSELLSFAIRKYVTRSINISACNSTPVEINKSFRTEIKKKLPILPKDHVESLSTTFFDLISELEEAAYGNSPEVFDSRKWREIQISKAYSLFTKLSNELERERKRTELITDKVQDKRLRSEGL